ncbi:MULTISPECIES: hypothetical protein [Pseudomonas]|uniref:Uncharacterized protein n=1 Tax=Pseudomonas helleri TaxID=1608996 RepID=A0A7X1X0T4_9PSED|nr:hypothetical protein [Pseudomonas helleri]MQT77283.1 hypothetical protein [Pseudomonas helleri]
MADLAATADLPASSRRANNIALEGSRSKFASCIIDYLPRNPTPARHRQSELADRKRCRLRHLSTRAAAMIRMDTIWLATEPLDMRAGTDTALAWVTSMPTWSFAGGSNICFHGWESRITGSAIFETLTAMKGRGTLDLRYKTRFLVLSYHHPSTRSLYSNRRGQSQYTDARST